MKIKLVNIEKKYNEELLFSGLHHEFIAPGSTAILGINGSGKSTLLQIIAGYISPGKGEVVYEYEGKKIEEEYRFQYVSLCAPYMELIEEMTLIEFLNYHFSFKKKKMDIEQMVQMAGLSGAANKLIEKFSSGMKQRVKLLQTFMSDSPILLLDEPCTNLDESGFKFYEQLMHEFTENSIVIVASNDVNEYKYCTNKYLLTELK